MGLERRGWALPSVGDRRRGRHRREAQFAAPWPSSEPRAVEVGVQTDFAVDATPVQFSSGVSGVQHGPTDQPLSAALAEMKGERIGVWRGFVSQPEAGAGLLTLDMIDLHAILQSSQVISSVLWVKELLKTICGVIL